MRAWTVVPGKAGSGALRDVAEPDQADGSVLVATLGIGVCGTDREILDGGYGEAPAGARFLILGHECVGRVLSAPQGAPIEPGDHVVPVVRRPDPVPCANCAVGEWDMCRNGRYTERGIRGRHGYAAERFRVEPELCVRIAPRLAGVGTLLEPASIVAKAWEHVEHIGARARFSPKRALVTGAGPIGLLAALLGVQRGLEVRVFDRFESPAKLDRVRELGATPHRALHDACEDADIVIECTGAGQLVIEVMHSSSPNGIVCLTGISSGRRDITVDASALDRSLVLENAVVFGSVNANLRHYAAAAQALEAADPRWLEALVTRRVALDEWQAAVTRDENDIKTVITIGK